MSTAAEAAESLALSRALGELKRRFKVCRLTGAAVERDSIVTSRLPWDSSPQLETVQFVISKSKDEVSSDRKPTVSKMGPFSFASQKRSQHSIYMQKHLLFTRPQYHQ